MSFWSRLGSFFVNLWNNALFPALIFLKDIFIEWLGIFIAPFTNLEMIWVIIPIYIVWIFSDFFGEKKGASFGNVISNGAVACWVAVDWARLTTNRQIAGLISISVLTFAKYFIAGVVFIYGINLIIGGIKAKVWAKKIGRIRWVTYFFLMFTPIIYDIYQPDIYYFAAVVLFFPIFYFGIELINKLLPNTVEANTDKEVEKLDKEVKKKDRKIRILTRKLNGKIK